MNRDLPVLGIDMDDVTADLISRSVELYNKDNYDDQIKKEDLNCWYGNWEIMKDYYMMEGIYADLPVIEGSKEVLKRLGSRYEIFFITASPTPKATFDKMEWVDRHFPFIGSGRVIATRYKHLINADLLFDDSPAFLPEFKGLRVLMDGGHNQHLVKGVDYEERVFDWKGFESYIIKVEEKGLLGRIR